MISSITLEPTLLVDAIINSNYFSRLNKKGRYVNAIMNGAMHIIIE
jgi:hypothetical protein